MTRRKQLDLISLRHPARFAQIRAFNSRGFAFKSNPPSLSVGKQYFYEPQVLDNLVSNALQHTPAGGEISLSAKQAGSAVQIIVRDTGVGIAAQDLPRVFERFYRGDRARPTEEGSLGITCLFCGF